MVCASSGYELLTFNALLLSQAHPMDLVHRDRDHLGFCACPLHTTSDNNGYLCQRQRNEHSFLGTRILYFLFMQPTTLLL